MSSELLYDKLEQFGRRRLGGSAARGAVGVPARIFDLVLDPELAPVWSILYMPIVSESPFGLGRLIHSNEALGRLSMSQGGAAPAIVEFDWGQGGVLQVPASNVQLDVIVPATMATDAATESFTAWAVPAPLGARGGWQQNTRTFELGTPPTGAPALTVNVPAFARSWSVGAMSGGAAAGVLETFILASDGTGLELWNRDFPANNLGGPLEDQHVLPRRAAVFSVLQSALAAGAITRVQYRFHLAI